jgi:hypothetical protein
MRSNRIRLQIAVLIFILLPAATGVVAVHASATCEKFVRTYVTKPVRNQVSKVTAEAWAKWREEHPNWKPNPNTHRPKYVMTREEAVNKVEFACSVPEIPATTALFFKTASLDPPPLIQLPEMFTQTGFPELPTEVAEVTPESWPPLGTFVPPAVNSAPQLPENPPPPPVGGSTPEPLSLLLVGTGICFLWLMGAWRVRETA